MGMSFLKKGNAAKALMDKADQEAEAKKAQQNAPRRYWMPPDKENQITFLDGDLDDEGLLGATTYWEHNLKLSGHWRNWFPCTQLDEPCPICEGGDNPSLIAIFTVIDHGEFTDNKGVKHKNEKRLFAAKRETFRRLQKIAAKKGGLTGITFDVSRSGEMSPGTGDVFDFVEKQSLIAIGKKYGISKEDCAPFNYDDAITYRNAKELRKLGFGEAGGPAKVIGAGDGDEAEEGASKGTNYDDEV